MPAFRSLTGEHEEAMGWGGVRRGWAVPAPHIVTETKLGIVSEMQRLDRPIFAQELYEIWGGRKPQATFDYHLSTLVQAGVAEVLIGPELSFRLRAAPEP
jgi:hypothetical protein